MSQPQEEETQTQPNGKPRGKFSAFLHEHGPVVAAVAGLAAALITIFVVTRNGGSGNGTSPVNPNSTSTDGTPSGSGTPNTPGQDLGNFTTALTSLAQNEASLQQAIAAEQASINTALGKLTSSGASQGTPVTRPTPPDTRPLKPAMPVGTGTRKGTPVKPTVVAPKVNPVKQPSAKVEVAVPRAKDTTPKVVAPKSNQTSINVSRMRPVAS